MDDDNAHGCIGERLKLEGETEDQSAQSVGAKKQISVKGVVLIAIGVHSYTKCWKAIVRSRDSYPERQGGSSVRASSTFLPTTRWRCWLGGIIAED